MGNSNTKIVIAGPASAGKSTLINVLKETTPNGNYVATATAVSHKGISTQNPQIILDATDIPGASPIYWEVDKDVRGVVYVVDASASTLTTQGKEKWKRAEHGLQRVISKFKSGPILVLANKWDEVVAANFTLNDFKTSMCYSMLTSPQNKPNAVEVECFRVAINNSTTPSERYDYDDAITWFLEHLVSENNRRSRCSVM